MIKNLADIADIRILFVFRDKAPVDVSDGNVYVFTIRDLVSNWPFDPNKMMRTRVDDDKLNGAVTEGDILLPGRGQAFPARLYQGQHGPVLPSGQIYVIRPKDATALISPYLSWYLNRPRSQQAMSRALTGTTIQALNKSALQKLQIHLPALETQHKIAFLHDLFEKRSQLRRELIALESQELELTCAAVLLEGTA
jgi:restriction endonuclease S subunit